MMYYKCEHCKGAPVPSHGYPRKWKWKTERGLKNHRCYLDDVEAMKKREARQAEAKKAKDKENAEKLKERIKTSEYKVGDEVYYVSYAVTAPTHKQRGSRMVRVRYEEKRRYSYYLGTIQKVQLCGYLIRSSIVSDNDVFKTEQEAKEEALKSQNSYDERCEFAAFCR